MSGKRGDSARKAFDRVAGELRARMADGTYALGTPLPSQRDIAHEFDVSRDTVQRVLRELRNEGWVESRQGSGTRVIKTQRIESSSAKATRSRRGVTLGPLIGEAFERPEVSLDVYTLTAESLDAHIRLQAERIRAGFIRPRRIALRMLLPDPSLALPYPRAMDDKDAPRLRDRLLAITARHTESLRGVLRDLRVEGLVPDVDLQTRYAPLTPTFKLYVINGAEVLFGPYEVIERPVVLDTGEEIRALDVLGIGATLVHHVLDAGSDSPGSVFATSMQAWFESVWGLLATE